MHVRRIPSKFEPSLCGYRTLPDRAGRLHLSTVKPILQALVIGTLNITHTIAKHLVTGFSIHCLQTAQWRAIASWTTVGTWGEGVGGWGREDGDVMQAQQSMLLLCVLAQGGHTWRCLYIARIDMQFCVDNARVWAPRALEGCEIHP